MCLAIPGKITKIDGQNATVDFDGIIKETNISLIKNVAIGEFVIVHAGFAIQKLQQKDAEDILKIVATMPKHSHEHGETCDHQH